ncbi:unnamed protein product [Fusarium langsethiae]|nr:unnamed protein product [Fusarium langsethiae]
MRIFNIVSTLVLLWVVAASAPTYEGFDIIWQDSFDGSAGSLPDTSKWIMQDWFKDLNGDWQTYTTSPANQQLTGDGSLLITPLRDSSATRGWTSGRLESAYTFTPAPASAKQGIWPAFWLLGDSHRRGTLIWPTCGEIDIMENVNGETKTQGVIHCDKNPGGICNEKNGIAGATALPDAGQDFHTYTAVIDRTPGNWMEESVSFFLDGVQYHQVTCDRMGNEEVWGKIAHNSIHFILNVAVGGEWPGDPDESTLDGLDNAIEVEYVAHYESTGSGGVPVHQDIENGPMMDEYSPVAEPQRPHSSRPSSSPSFPELPPSSEGEGFSIFEVAGRPGVYAIPGVSGIREVRGRPGVYETPDNRRYEVPELPGLREIPGEPGLYQVSGSHGSHSSSGYPETHKTPTHHNFPAPEQPSRQPSYDPSQFSSFPPPKSDRYSDSPDSSNVVYPGGSGYPVESGVIYSHHSSHLGHRQPRPVPVPNRMTDAERENQPSPMNPTRGRNGSPDGSTTEYSHEASQPPHRSSPYSQGGFSQAQEANSQYPHGGSRPSRFSSGGACLAPSAGDPHHGTYGRPGGWGPGTGKDCPDDNDSKLKARQISPHEGDEELESEIDSESSKPEMPYRFKTPGYPPAPGPDAVAPPTVNPGDFGGVQAKDKGKYLDQDMPYRFETPDYPPAPESDAVTPPTVTPGEFGGVQSKDKGEYLDRSRVTRDMPYRFKTPPPAPGPDAIAPPTVAPDEFGGVQAQDKGKYLDPRGVDEPAPVSSQGTPRYRIYNEASRIAFIFAFVALVVLY